MDDNEKPKFSLAVTAMIVGLGREATAPMLLGYWIGLRDLTLQQVESAVAKAMQTATRLPVPAELRELAVGGSAESRAIAAWDDVQRAANVSYMADLDFGDWIINAVIRNLGGRWNFFSRLNEGAESEKWLRHEFLKTYAVLASTLPSDEATQPLIGQATHGTVAGRTHQPRLITIKADETRLALLPKRSSINIDAQPQNQMPRIQFQKA